MSDLKSGTSPRLTLRHAAIQVTDLQRSLQLFCGSLGFLPYHTTDQDWAMVQREGTSLSLVRVASKAPRVATEKGAHPSHLGLTAHSPEAVDALQKELVKLTGVTVGKISAHRDGSRGFYFQDYDHNPFEIIFIPYRARSRPPERTTILVAHGSRDAQWKQSFERLRERVQLHLAGAKVGLAYMELTDPSLSDVVAQMHAGGARQLEIVPVFLASGVHVRRDIQGLVDKAKQDFPDCEFTLRTALGEQPGVVEAMVAAVVGD